MRVGGITYALPWSRAQRFLPSGSFLPTSAAGRVVLKYVVVVEVFVAEAKAEDPLLVVLEIKKRCRTLCHSVLATWVGRKSLR